MDKFLFARGTTGIKRLFRQRVVRSPVAVCAALVTLSSQPGYAQQATFEPSGDWSISSDEESCTLVRSFYGRQAGDTTLFIRSWGPYAPSQVSVVGPSLVRDESRSVIADISIGDMSESVPVAAIASSYRDVARLTFQLALPRRQGDERMNGFGRGGYVDGRMLIWAGWSMDAASLSFDTEDTVPHTLHVGSLREPLQMLEDCESDLLESWGFDHSREANLSRYPTLTNRDRVNYWIIYPPNLMLNRRSRIVQFRARITEEGRAEDCVIQAPEWNSRNRRQSCRAIEDGARFEPALDAQGNPTEALFRASMFFVMFD